MKSVTKKKVYLISLQGMKLASILYEPKGYGTERKLWNKIWLTITEQTTYACMTAKSGKSVRNVL